MNPSSKSRRKEIVRMLALRFFMAYNVEALAFVAVIELLHAGTNAD
jgi:hypothetical protein